MHIFMCISFISATFVSVHCRVVIKSIYFPCMNKIPNPATVYCCKKYVKEMKSNKARGARGSRKGGKGKERGK